MKNNVNILGTKYNIVLSDPGKDENLGEDGMGGFTDGYTDPTTKTIVVQKLKVESGTVKGVDEYQKKILRHEIVHAFMYESGLAECSMTVQNWAVCEEIIDYIAIQGRKLYKAWEEAEAI